MYSSSSEFTSSSDEELIEMVRRRRHPKVFNERRNPFNQFSDEEFFDRFRFTKDGVNEILGYIDDTIKFDSARNQCLTPMNQLLLTLRFYASGCMLISAGDFIGVTKATAGRIIKKETVNEIRDIQAGFYEIARFPKVIGNHDAELYRNRKGYFSYNVQTTCDYNLKITNIVARWPGSTHDQTIFNNSRLKTKLESGIYNDCFLLGDNGYRNSNYLLTPLLQPHTAAEEKYNSCHIITRNTVERQYGILQRRFPILSLGMRERASLGMRVNKETAKIIFVATAVLHNIAINRNEPLPIQEDILVEAADAFNEGNNEANNNTRQRLIQNYFQNLL
ncbi:DDE superfamily endonuclease [Popillia japonica]|uniref:DDE superfamily endonuclease n=1 Tax=Popillia japonica TaxID=7064 RepID=A0AAW1MXT9_POPJA